MPTYTESEVCKRKMPKSHSRKISTNCAIKRVTSHESLHSPKTFTEEVADALGMRARTLGNSHPSVLFGKEKKLIESLINVAEVLKTANKKTEEKSSDIPHSPCFRTGIVKTPQIRKKNSTFNENREHKKPDLVAGDSNEQGARLKTRTNSTRSKLISRTTQHDHGTARNVSQCPWAVVENEFIECSGIPRESNSIHIRLAYDACGENCTSTSGCFGATGTGCFRCTRKAGIIPQEDQYDSRKQTIPRIVTPKSRMPTSFLRKEDRETIRNIFEASSNRQPTTKTKKSVGNRIRAIANRSHFKTARKRVRSAVNTGMKRAEETYERVKKCFVTRFRN